MSITEIVPAESVAGLTSHRVSAVAEELALPAVVPGQLWLIELAPDTPSATLRHVLAGANVVIYDRALTDLVAHTLPLGSYAEPAAAHEASAARCVGFARDGWSVARLLPAHLPARERTRRLQDLVDELAAAKIPGGLPVLVVAQSGNGDERLAARFDDLASLVAAHPRETRLAIAIDAFAGAATRPHAVAANGLAG